MVPSMSSEDGPAAVFAEDAAVMVKFPRTEEGSEEQGDRRAEAVAARHGSPAVRAG